MKICNYTIIYITYNMFNKVFDYILIYNCIYTPNKTPL